MTNVETCMLCLVKPCPFSLIEFRWLLVNHKLLSNLWISRCNFLIQVRLAAPIWRFFILFKFGAWQLSLFFLHCVVDFYFSVCSIVWKLSIQCTCIHGFFLSPTLFDPREVVTRKTHWNGVSILLSITLHGWAAIFVPRVSHFALCGLISRDSPLFMNRPMYDEWVEAAEPVARLLISH